MIDYTPTDHAAIDGPGDDRVDARSLATAQLAQALRDHAGGSYRAVASVGLLVGDGGWLCRDDFLDHVEVSRQPSRRFLAAVDWRQVRAAQLPASFAELQLLDLAGELAGLDSGRPLAELVTGLDDRNLLRVLQAISHAHQDAVR